MPRAREPYSNLFLIDFKSPHRNDELIDQGIIDNRLPGNYGPFFRILDLAKAHKCKTIIVENKYIDEDFLEEYSSFYSRVFKPIAKECIRVHFFSTKISDNELLDLKRYENNYIGYTIIRPISAFKTGRTVIKPFINNASSQFILCKEEFRLNLSGTSLNIAGMPFVQQDTYIGACAHAPIWMASLYMHKKFSYPRYLPSTISETAIKYLFTGVHPVGLIQEQMLEVLRTAGLLFITILSLKFQ
jgi:hypothetical protein